MAIAAKWAQLAALRAAYMAAKGEHLMCEQQVSDRRSRIDNDDWAAGKLEFEVKQLEGLPPPTDPMKKATWQMQILNRKQQIESLRIEADQLEDGIPALKAKAQRATAAMLGIKDLIQQVKEDLYNMGATDVFPNLPWPGDV